MGGELDDGGGRKVTHIGGWTKCIVLKEDMGLEDVQRKVSEITGNDLTVRKLWYSLKYGWGMVMELEGDGDVRMFLKGNDKHGYLYVGESDGLKRRIEKATWTCDDGVVCGRSGRGRDDMVEEARKGAGVKRLRVNGEKIEMSDDDKISVASEDVGEGEAAVEGGEESNKGEYSVELTSSCKLVVKLGQQTYTYRVWQTRGIPCCHALAVIAKAKLWVYNYVHPIYKTATQQIIYNQLVHPMETHDVGTFDAKTGWVVGRDELDDDYNRCILPPTNGRQPSRPSSKCKGSQTQGTRQPEMFTWEEAEAHHGKPWSTTGKSVGNLLCYPSKRLLLAVVNHDLQVGAGMFTPVSVLMTKYGVALSRAIK
ncbi:hypothetical protein Cgig2_025241 [Carnegiea gigantea]|uniref:Zinc finger PMZ-type domain-containing protein n=1 Tax=Carnegiea gigantea TaxID=171969 RepID=A0A9Q1GTU6_9CARY|nr:hypothetical protein Cgig2_025241 [Carnegiea gigantea]